MSTPGTFGNDARGRFLGALSSGATVKEACSEAGVSRNTVYTHRRVHDDFAAGWAEALEDGTEALEAEARRRAMTGSDTLMIFLLKARRPEVYRERQELHHTGDRPLAAGDLEAIRAAGARPELAAAYDLIAAELGRRHRGESPAALELVPGPVADNEALPS